MAIKQVSTANTFEHWLTATQQLIAVANTLTDGNGATFIANTILEISGSGARLNVKTSAEVANVFSNNITVTKNTIANVIYANTIIFPDGTTLGSQTSSDIITTLNQYGNTLNVVDDITSINTMYPLMALAANGLPTRIYASSTKLYYNVSTGQINATNFNSLSDLNSKTDIETIQNALETLLQIRGVTFRWKDSGEKSIGVIAQEIEQYLPEVVSTNEHGEKSVSYGSIVGLIIEAVKDLNNRVIQIENYINKDNQ